MRFAVEVLHFMVQRLYCLLEKRQISLRLAQQSLAGQRSDWTQQENVGETYFMTALLLHETARTEKWDRLDDVEQKRSVGVEPVMFSAHTVGDVSSAHSTSRASVSFILTSAW